jgi:MSHA biogenesis protein MshJ
VSNPFQEEFSKLSAKFDSITVREQLLLLVCGLMVFAIIIHMLLLEPRLLNNEKTQKDIERSQKELQSLMVQTQELSEALLIDANLPAKTRLNKLTQQILEIEQQLTQQTANLVPANQMPLMLEKVLATSNGLKVLSLESIPPTSVLVNQPPTTFEKTAESDLYRHGIKLMVEGSYFDIQRYLAKLEALDWQFYWKRFDYKVSQYPLAVVELEIYTLSTNKAFIGV